MDGAYFDNASPVNSKPFCQVARARAADMERALDAAHAAKDAWRRTSVTDRANTLLKIAERVAANTQKLAVAEPRNNGKAVREPLTTDLPLVVDHFRYFAGCIRAPEGSIGEIDEHTVAYHFHEALGLAGQIMPWISAAILVAENEGPRRNGACLDQGGFRSDFRPDAQSSGISREWVARAIGLVG